MATASGRRAVGAASPGGPAQPLDNAVWEALTTRHAHLAEGIDGARRYRPDVSPFYAVDQLDDEAWEALRALSRPGGPMVLIRDHVPEPPPGWVEMYRGAGHQMLLAGPLAPPTVAVRALTDDDVPEMLALVALTRPGPFSARAIELGSYVGVEEGGHLVAMAGERLRLPGHTEVSAVCTHPDLRGRGLAAALTTHVALGILARGEVPFLHVAADNEPARRVYERLGLRTRRLVEFAVLAAPSPEPGGS